VEATAVQLIIVETIIMEITVEATMVATIAATKVKFLK